MPRQRGFTAYTTYPGRGLIRHPLRASARAGRDLRLLIQTGRRLGELTAADLDELAAAGREREQRTGQGWRHYQSGLSFTHRVLFHLGILAVPPETGPKPVPFATGSTALLPRSPRPLS